MLHFILNYAAGIIFSLCWGGHLSIFWGMHQLVGSTELSVIWNGNTEDCTETESRKGPYRSVEERGQWKFGCFFIPFIEGFCETLKLAYSAASVTWPNKEIYT